MYCACDVDLSRVFLVLKSITPPWFFTLSFKFDFCGIRAEPPQDWTWNPDISMISLLFMVQVQGTSYIPYILIFSECIDIFRCIILQILKRSWTPWTLTTEPWTASCKPDITGFSAVQGLPKWNRLNPPWTQFEPCYVLWTSALSCQRMLLINNGITVFSFAASLFSFIVFLHRFPCKESQRNRKNPV